MKLFEKIYLRSYLRSVVVLSLDLVVSVAATAIAILLAHFWARGAVLTPISILALLAGSLGVSWAFFCALRVQKAVIRHSSLHSMGRLTLALMAKAATLALLFLLLPPAGMPTIKWMILLTDLLLSFALLVGARILMTVAWHFLQDLRASRRGVERILIFGATDKSASLVTRLAGSPHYRVAGFLCQGNRLRNYQISGFNVFTFQDQASFCRLAQKQRISGILFAVEDDARQQQEQVIKWSTRHGLRILIAPTIDEAVGGKLMKQNIRQIRIEDLLGRDEIHINLKEVEQNFAGKVVMVTGAAGSIGSEICRQLATFGVGQLILFDNAETPMHNIRLELEERFPGLSFVPVIGDVRLPSRLDYAFGRFHPQVVFHAAAYKHVPLMEENPCEAVMVNACGSRNVADKCIEYGVEKMVMISTDKAVNPTNIMGCTKRLAEIYVQSLGLAVEAGTHPGHTKFVTTRFGNVLGSNGSVIPRFREQIEKGGPVTVTHPDITRFFMTIPEACRLVMEAATMTTGNQIFVFDMGESVKISTLADRMIRLAGLTPGRDIEIAYTGLRPGEKLYEEVLSNAENTLPTDHKRIRIAKVRKYPHPEARDVISRLETLARQVDVPATVRLMKLTVPEFKSKNSQFEQYDHEE